MVNKIEFTNRLKKILEYHQLTASLFADKIGVQRSSISHILSGRNKPSLDFILKVTNTFSDVDIYWLLNGKGSFPNKSDVAPPYPTTNSSIDSKGSSSNSIKKMDRVVVFYTDGTFDEYKKG
jgi:transcriptional regulator with XRE-family HTH domain